jgi:hypothetical protein
MSPKISLTLPPRHLPLLETMDIQSITCTMKLADNALGGDVTLLLQPSPFFIMVKEVDHLDVLTD